jgi:hypothetical protein
VEKAMESLMDKKSWILKKVLKLINSKKIDGCFCQRHSVFTKVEKISIFDFSEKYQSVKSWV